MPDEDGDVLRKITAKELEALPDGSEFSVSIEDFDALALADGRKAIRESFRVLRDGGTVELSILDAQWLFEAWRDGRGTDEGLCEIVFGTSRRAVWDERTVVREGFEAGYFKIWSGRVGFLPIHMLHVKMLKYTVLTA